MKRNVLSLAVVACAFLVTLITCKNEDEITLLRPDSPSIPFFNKTKNMEFSSTGGEQTISFSTNKSWELHSPVAWCKTTPDSGDKGDNISVKITTEMNDTFDDRNATLTLKAQDSIRTLVVTQKQKDALTLTRAKYEVGVEGGIIEVEVKANIDFMVEIPDKYKSWIKQQTADQTKGLESTHLTFQIEPSTEYDLREGEIIIKNNLLSETLKVYQSGSAILVLTNKDYEIPGDGGNITVEIKSNFDFAVNMPDVDWISINKTKAVSTHTLYYTIAPNNSSKEREAEIVYFDKNSNISETVKIKQSPKNSPCQVTLNINDPHILSIKTPENETISLYGRKNEDGITETIEQILLTDKKGNNIDFTVDEHLRPTNIHVYNGVSFNLEWLSDTQVILTGFDSNSNIQINTLIDRTQTIDPTSEETKAAMTARTGKLKLKIRPIKEEPQTRSEITQGGIILSVKQCDSPMDATTWIDVYNYTTDNYLTRLLVKEVISEGRYYYECPSSVFPTVSIADILEGIGKVLEPICTVNDFLTAGFGPMLCPSISLALLSTGIGSAAAPEFFIACEAITLGTDLICSTLGASAGSGSSGILDMLATAEILQKEYNVAPLRLVPVVDALPNYVYGQSVIFQPNQASAQLTVDLGGKPLIRSFTLNPSSPHEGQSYIAIADLFCIPLGSTIIISIVGTDGYTDSITTTPSSVNFQAELYVPGAQSGVRDVCTVKIVYPNGETLTRQAALVFN